jgi:hypothetical protein
MNAQAAQSLKIKNEHLARAWASVKQVKPDDRQGLSSKTWADIPLRTRAVLVMLGAVSDADPREVARRPWGSLTDADRHGIATCAREMGKHLRAASCLF